jgi:tetratricopeptide (TPR) repeat protein
MKHGLALIIPLALVACGKKSSPPAASSGSSVTAPAPTPAAGSAAAPTPTPTPAPAANPAAAKGKPAPLTKEARAEYRKRLQAGRTLAKAAKWPEAIAELEAALVAIPGDDRALSELSFAAMSSGDAAKARTAGRQAVLVATDPKIKAAALYNLGRVEEVAAPAKAAALYKESLALRPNKIVQQRLADLATRGADVAAPLPCATPMAEAALCGCLQATVVDDLEGRGRCEVAPTAVDGFKTITYDTSATGEATVVVVAQVGDRWAVVAPLANIYNPGAFGINEEWTLDKVTEETLGGHAVVRFESSKHRSDTDMGVDEFESEDTKQLLVCVRDAKGGAPRCPVDVVTDYKYERDRLGMAEDGDLDELTKGLPIKRQSTVAVTLTAEGVAQVRVTQGRPDGAPVGDLKLW